MVKIVLFNFWDTLKKLLHKITFLCKKIRALSIEVPEASATKVEHPKFDLILDFANIELLWYAG